MEDRATGYELSRAWFDWSFENPEKISPSHTALYFFIIEHCNRLGWKQKFGLPSLTAMEAIGIKNWRTYKKALDDLVDFGFIELIEVSRNQYTSNIVAIVNNTKAHTKALDKALIKHSSKQSESKCQGTVEGIAHIDKQRTKNNRTKNKTCESDVIEVEVISILEFEEFWNLYDKKIGSKPKIEKKWQKISEADRARIKEYIPQYKIAEPNKKFRKNPETFLNNQSWNDELIYNNNESNESRRNDKDTERIEELARYAARAFSR